ncbi:MAG: NFACT RNA binding domain-containing protein [Balneolia bacterium]|nr:NFACT RNA binding domain-containing protein [Balneolia bacterium]
MNNYFTLIYLAKELNAILSNAIFIQAVTYKKNMLDLFFESETEQIKLSFSADSVRTALFTDPRVSSRKSNSASFFEKLKGKQVECIELTENDRFLSIRFSDSEYFLQFKLFSNEPNAFLIGDGVISEAFKNPGRYEEARAPEPLKPRNTTFTETSGKLKRRIQQSFPLLPRNFIKDLIEHGELESLDDEKINLWLKNASHQLATNPEPAILSDGRFTIFSSEFIDRDGAETFGRVNDAVRIAFYTESRENRFEKYTKELFRRAEKLLKKYDAVIKAGEEASKSLDRAERYEQLGNILVAHAHMKHEGEEHITLPDFYNNNDSVEIPIDPSLDIAANAQIYFEKKKKSERSFESALEYRDRILERKAELETIVEKIQQVSHLREIEEVSKEYPDNDLFTEKNKADNTSVRPYKVIKLGKYDIWVGKNAKSNDAVLRDAHKDDIWLHASGVSGSHVVIRMNKAQTDPDMSLLETVASWAAWMSKGKGTAVCPVKWTRRKFVRKPKGAAPGAALVDKENVILVEPQEPPKQDYK